MISLVDLEAHPENCIGFAPREKREALQAGMLARILITDGARRERVWTKIRRVDITAGAHFYHAELVDDTFMDIGAGDKITFEPQHVCEWDVAPRLTRPRARS